MTAVPADAMPLACPHCGHMPTAVVHGGVTTNYEHDFGTLPGGADCLHAGVIWPEQLPAWNSRPPVDEAAVDVLAERRRQIEVEGWTPAHDDEHKNGEMARAASCYAVGAPAFMAWDLWPWDRKWWKPGDRRRDLVKAGALILAEIERLDRAALTAAITEKQP